MLLKVFCAGIYTRAGGAVSTFKYKRVFPSKLAKLI